MGNTKRGKAGGGSSSSSGSTDPLVRLQVFERLEIGPVTVERRRLIAPYRLVWRGGEDSIDLIYRYEERVFDPADDTSRNLACMVCAQVALNYGLFCRSIVFHGPFDETDRRFLRDMMDNTSREIYVKKFLEPNPFLVGEGAHVPFVKKERYTAAAIEFPDSTPAPASTMWRLWTTDHSRHAVLSSGGKDSLLSFGLIDELGYEVHPIFVNESGRHWFTALNAYRYFQKHVPNTGRVWTNADRVFAWMLRHMPFIRRDFTNVRADEYAVRLWTVAVFLFGVLPLVRKRGIGRVVIGDEYDTTQRSTHRGIPHYNGLFDQSRYFDNALSRYYLRKAWGLAQFSIVRPLSEMLIEKILVERYPALQRHQMSCHATHVEKDRIRPCGKCEKCRRIVGMLLAIDADPMRCGYTREQIEECRRSIVEKGVHQESAGVEHLMRTLAEKRVIDLPPGEKQSLREHPEIMRLRFDAVQSPIDGIPVDMRIPIIKIFLEHADGAVKRTGREWAPFDPLNDPDAAKQYVFDARAARDLSSSLPAAALTPKGYLWGELTYPEAEKLFKEVDIALLPVGSIEQHGPHLPLDNDGFDAFYLAQRIADACSEPKPLVLPLLPYGVSYEHDEFKGTISISNDTLSHLVYEIGMSIARNGINKIVIINGHGGNTPALHYAAQMITREARIFVCVETGETSDVDIYKLAETPNDIHAGEIETSTALAVRPHLVKRERAAKSIPRFSSRYLNFTSRRGVSWYVYTKRLSKTGVIGDPTKASAEKGERFWRVMIAHLVALVEDLKDLTLEEIYQKRY